MSAPLLLSLAFVTVNEKIWHMAFSVKVEFDVWLISSTIELTRVQVLEPLCASLWRYIYFSVSFRSVYIAVIS